MKLLILGGSHFQVYAILQAKQMGIYTITCDYLPNNPGHKLSDEYHNISIVDKEKILELARKIKIDGILAYASDIAAPTAAFVAEALGLPTSPYKSVEILTSKHLFREFLRENGFNVPRFISFSTLDSAMEGIENLRFPLMLKPVDSSGSKGVCKVESKQDLIKHFTSTIAFSRTKRAILEEWIEYDGYQIAGDGFSIDGELVFSGFANEHFSVDNVNPFCPICESFPYSGDEREYALTREAVQDILRLLDMKSGAYNFDIRLKDKEVYFLELAPRNGGNLIPQVIEKTFGVNLVKASICAALGLPLDWLKKEIKNSKIHGFYACYVLHARENGIFYDMEIDENLARDICSLDVYVKKGEFVSDFSGSNATLGVMIFRSSSKDEMMYRIENMDKLLKILMGGGKSKCESTRFLCFRFWDLCRFYRFQRLQSRCFSSAKKECVA